MTRTIRRSLVGTCVAPLAVLALVAGCSEAPKRAPTAEKSSTSSSAPSPTTSAKPAKPTRADLPAGSRNGFDRNLATIFTGCDRGAATQLEETAQLFDTKTGQSVDLPRPAIDPKDEVKGINCTVTQAADGSPRVIYLAETHTPSEGLKPESDQARLYSFKPGSDEPVAVKDFPLDLSESWYLYPGVGSVAVYTTTFGGSLDDTTFFDPDTLEVTATFRDDPRYVWGFNYYGFAVADDSPSGPTTLRFLDNHGQEVGSFPDFGDIATTERGFLVENAAETGVQYFNMETKTLSGVVAPYLVGDELLHAGDQIAWRHTPETAAAQTFGDHLIMFGNLDDKGNYLTVLDLEKGEAVFTLNDEQLDGLGIDEAFVAGNYVYLEKESDSPVIDFRTGDVAAPSWSLLPTALLDDGWALVATEAADQRYPMPWGNDGYLARAADGKAYDGPWF